MGNKCTIYYATVVNSEKFDWSKPSHHDMEPVNVEGREPLGKQPDFCCEGLSKLNDQYRLHLFSGGKEMNIQVIQVISIHHRPLDIHFCPYCGAKIALKEHLKLKVIETPITRHVYHYEVV